VRDPPTGFFGPGGDAGRVREVTGPESLDFIGGGGSGVVCWVVVLMARQVSSCWWWRCCRPPRGWRRHLRKGRPAGWWLAGLSAAAVRGYWFPWPPLFRARGPWWGCSAPVGGCLVFGQRVGRWGRQIETSPH